MPSVKIDRKLLRYRSARDPEKHVSHEAEKEGEIKPNLEDSNMRLHETAQRGNLYGCVPFRMAHFGVEPLNTPPYKKNSQCAHGIVRVRAMIEAAIGSMHVSQLG